MLNVYDGQLQQWLRIILRGACSAGQSLRESLPVVLVILHLTVQWFWLPDTLKVQLVQLPPGLDKNSSHGKTKNINTTQTFLS